MNRQVCVRLPIGEDAKRITSDWLQSCRQNGFLCKGVSNRVFFDQHHKILEALLPRTTTVIVCWADQPEEVLGWMTFEIMDRHLVLHYLYVKHAHRRNGLARKMFDYVMSHDAWDLVQNRVITTHQTFVGKDITTGSKQFPSWTQRHPERKIDWLYNPYLLFYTLPEHWERGHHEGI